MTALRIDEAKQIKRRRSFIERMERKLAYKTLLQRHRRQRLRERLGRIRQW